MDNQVRPKVTVVVPFVVYPPISGGQLRAFHLYNELSKWIDVEMITLTYPGAKLKANVIKQGFTEIRVPKSSNFSACEIQLTKDLQVHASLVSCAMYYKELNLYRDEIRKSCESSVAVIACHPYVYDIIKETTDKPILYEAQDFEYKLYSRLIPDGPNKDNILLKIQDIEKKML